MVAVQAALEEYPQTEWIWWLDADAIIMTPSIDLYEHILSPSALQNYTLTNHTIKPNERVPVIPTDETTSTSSVINPSEIDIIVTEDKGGLNLGSLLLRNTPTVHLLLTLFTDPLLLTYSNTHFRLKEQDLMLHFILSHPLIRDKVAFVPQRRLNAYQDRDDEMQRWHNGDLVAHFPNCGFHHNCVERWNRHWDLREVLPIESDPKAGPPTLIEPENRRRLQDSK